MRQSKQKSKKRSSTNHLPPSLQMAAVIFRVKDEATREKIKKFAKSHGYSLQKFLTQAVKIFMQQLQSQKVKTTK